MPEKLLVCLIKRFIVLNAADSSVNNQSDKGLAFESTRIKKSKGTHGGQGMIVAPTVPNTASKGILGAQCSLTQASTESVSVNTFEGTYGGQGLFLTLLPRAYLVLSVHLPTHLQG